MKIKLIEAVIVDGLEFGENSVLDLDPVYAEALISRKKAVPERGLIETPEDRVQLDTEKTNASYRPGNKKRR
jgi:hypothetical protein